jgi:hypothetical protein
MAASAESLSNIFGISHNIAPEKLKTTNIGVWRNGRTMEGVMLSIIMKISNGEKSQTAKKIEKQ